MKAKKVLKLLSVSRVTLTKYVKNGWIKVFLLPNGKYLYNGESVYKFVGIKNKKKEKTNVVYSRCSNPPKKHVDEQACRVLNFCINQCIKIDNTYCDIKSGMNFNRPGLEDLISDIVKGNIGLVVVENKDRLCRFGFELFETFCRFFGTKIVIINELNDKTYEQELTDDLISIIHYFSMKSYSHRRKPNKLKRQLENADT